MHLAPFEKTPFRPVYAPHWPLEIIGNLTNTSTVSNLGSQKRIAKVWQPEETFFKQWVAE